MSAVSLGEPIAGTHNLYAWGEGRILKLYGEETPTGFVEWLGKLERGLYAAGLPVPAVGETTEIAGCLGQVYERIEGSSIAEVLLGPPEPDLGRIVELAHVSAEVHAKIHACSNIPAGLSTQRFLATVIQRIDVLAPELKAATLKALDEMPEGDRLCHGDFHPYNVLMSPRGPIVIDWNNAHIGDPLEDVARSALILSGVAASQPSTQSRIGQFNRAYLEQYFRLRPGGQEQLVAWQPIVAAVRLSDDIPEIQEWLLEQIRTGLTL
jgi:aminoglycoside phosphotransferase (APT) family kinase protein